MEVEIHAAMTDCWGKSLLFLFKQLISSVLDLLESRQDKQENFHL